MATESLAERRRRRVEVAFAGLPARFNGAAPGFRARYEIEITDLDRTWEVAIDEQGCSVDPADSGKAKIDAQIGTDASTWLSLREGRLSGLDAFSMRRLYARGNLDLAIAFEGMFDLPGGRPPLLRVHRPRVRDTDISTLTTGTGPEHVICLHGLGSNKTSFFATASALAADYTVHAIDLPGFGSSTKPALAPYDAPYFARTVAGLMDELGIGSAHLIGNSMGGRVALELALCTPQRVRSLSLLAPALAFRRNRQLAPIVKLLRPELAAIPHPLRAAVVKRQFWSLFAQPDRLDPAVAEITADGFLSTYRETAARIAFYAAARNIYLDEPFGRDGFWERLAGLRPPALFIWGDADTLVPAGFSRHVADALPSARQAVLPDCGHVPQVELPEQTNAMITELITSATPGRALSEIRSRERMFPRLLARGA